MHMNLNVYKTKELTKASIELPIAIWKLKTPSHFKCTNDSII